MAGDRDDPLELETAVYVCEHAAAMASAQPVADLDRVAVGAEPLLELRLYLEELFATVRPAELARFAAVPGATLRTVTVPLEHEATPERFRATPAVALPVLELPDPRGSWAIILPLRYATFVPRGEKLEEVVAREAPRIVAARQASPWDYLTLLPAEEQRVESIRVPLRVPGADAPREDARRLLVRAEERRKAIELIETVALPWHEAMLAAPQPPVLSRDREARSLAALLGGEQRKSVLLVGTELVGKTAVLREWLRAASASGTARPVYLTSAARLVAGMSGLGQWQARVGRVVEAIESLDALLYLENLGDLFREGPESSVDLASALKPALDRERIRLVAELTPDALALLEPRHAGFFGCFTRLRIEPLDKDAAAGCLAALGEHDRKENPQRPSFTAAAVSTVVDLADRYLPYLPWPGKAVRLYEEVRAAHEKDPSLVGMAGALGPDDVVRVFSLQSGVPRLLLVESEPLAVRDVEAALAARVVGQELAVRRLAETVAVVKAGLGPRDRPLGVYLFVGPTGVGKTELARALAAYLFQSEERLARFDMSEHADADSVRRLMGGADGREGSLTRAVRERPFLVLLLDEIEKAHPAVFDLLLGVLGEGRLTDARGRTAFFHNTVVIMTSNLGTEHARTPIGIGATSAADADRYERAVKAAFRPELVGRIDRIVPFHPLGGEHVKRIARLQVAAIERRRGLAELGIALDASDEALDVLAEGGYSAVYGARALRRHLDDCVAVPLGELLAGAGRLARGATARIAVAPAPADAEGAVERGGVALWLELGGKTRERSARGFERVARVRREIDRWLHLPPVEELRDRIDQLVAEINDLARMKRRDGKLPRDAARLPKLQADHHRLAELWERARALSEEVAAVEELALGAALAGEEDPHFHTRAYAPYHSLKSHLAYLLVALNPVRNTVTLVVQEPDGGRGLDLWLDPLLDPWLLEKRGWSFDVHVPPGTEGAVADPGWPEKAIWGPPQTARWTRERLALPKRPFTRLLLRARGDHAGAFLALEAGLHRFRDVGPGKELVHLIVHLVTLEVDLPRAMYASPLLLPPPAPLPAERALTPAVREHRLKENRLLLLNGAVEMEHALDVYWSLFEDIAAEHLLATLAPAAPASDRLVFRHDAEPEGP